MTTESSLETLVARELDSEKRKGRIGSDFLHYFIAQDLQEQQGNLFKFDFITETLKKKLNRKEPYPTPVSLERFHITRDAILEDIKNGDFKYFLREGFFYLAQDTGNDIASMDKFIDSKETLLEIIGDSSIKINREWNPVHIDITKIDAENIISFLQERYSDNKDIFFKRYGNKAGAFYLTQDLESIRLKDPKLFRIGSFVGDGESTSRLTNIQDQRFRHQWNPDSIYVRYSDALKIKEFLKSMYEKDREKFYSLCEGLVGGLALPKELEKIGVSLSKGGYPSLLGTPEKVASLLEIKEDEIKGRWSFSSSISGAEATKEILSFTKRSYEKDREKFFDRYYFDELGSINLARDYKKATGKDIKINDASIVLSEGKSLNRIFGDEPRFKRKAFARRFDLYLSDFEKIVDFCKKRYEEDENNFFERYGSKNGIINLEEDLERKLDIKGSLNSRDVGRIIKKGKIIEKLMGIENERFNNEWKSRFQNFNTDQRKKILDFLRDRYNNDSSAFFERYGSNLGVAYLEKDLVEEDIRLSSSRLASMIVDKDFLQANMGIQDSRFETSWKPRSIQINEKDQDLLASALETTYKRDRLDFFIRYGSEAGQYILQQDIRASTGRSIPLQQINSLVRRPATLSGVTSIPLEDLEKNWNPHIIMISDRNINSLGTYLKSLYEESPETFFDYFKDHKGMFYVLGRFKNDRGKVPNTYWLNMALKNKGLVSLLVGNDDPAFKDWNPPKIEVQNNRFFEEVIDNLRTKYNCNPESFKERYGSVLGAVTLARDLQEKEFNKIEISEVYNLISQPSIIKSILQVEDDMGNEWNPQYFNLSLKQFDAIKDHLRTMYQKNQELFFKRYGSKVNRLILLGEMANLGIKRKPFDYSPFVVDGKVASQVLEIEDERFETQWRKKRSHAEFNGRILSYHDVTEKLKTGFKELSRDASLPQEREDRSNEYMTLRKILRASELENSKYLADLFALEPQKVKKVIEKQVEINQGVSLKISSLKDRSAIGSYGEQEFMRKTGELLYSFDENIRRQTQGNLVRLFGKEIGDMKIVQENPELWDFFSDYCLRKDIYHQCRNKELSSKSFKLNFTGLVYMKNRYDALKRNKSGYSLDSPLTSSKSGDDSAFHDIIA